MARLDETRSSVSSRSDARGSGVLARAREYNRIIDENRSRSRSGERKPVTVSEPDSPTQNKMREPQSSTAHGQGAANTRGLSTKERAIKSLDADAFAAGLPDTPVRNGSSKSNIQLATTKQNTSMNGNVAQPSHMVKQHENDANKPPPVTYPKSPVNFQAVSKQIAVQSLSPEQQQKKQPVDSQLQPLPAVTPELLVDALSGHEDGLLAIAERLMEHYDEGYDSMGEAIIDAFADVQKLFQHVVEAAHMEGAAYEAGRREEEAEKLKKSGLSKEKEPILPEPASAAGKMEGDPVDAGSQSRHEEFIDEDVREILEHAVMEGRTLKEKQKYTDCYVLYEQACQSASALLPVDSDHRGRLQLSLARAESMNPERACAILKYVIDDVLRSGLDSNVKVVMPDPSKRGDCVLQRPTPLKTSLSAIEQSKTVIDSFVSDGVNFQRSEEVLASIVEEMKEVLSAPMYANCHPLQDVASRFWVALNETQRMSLKNEERLEQKLGTLKGEYLLDREEWEDKYNSLYAEYAAYKKKMERIHEVLRMQAVARQSSNQNNYHDMRGLEELNDLTLQPIYSAPHSPPKEAASVVSLENLTYHAKSIFSCNSSTDDLQENGGHLSHDNYKLSPAVGKVSSNYLSQLDRNNDMRAFGNTRNR